MPTRHWQVIGELPTEGSAEFTEENGMAVIVLVEQDERTLRHMEAILRDMGHECHVITSAGGIEHLLREGGCDLLIVDYLMARSVRRVTIESMIDWAANEGLQVMVTVNTSLISEALIQLDPYDVSIIGRPISESAFRESIGFCLLWRDLETLDSGGGVNQELETAESGGARWLGF